MNKNAYKYALGLLVLSGWVLFQVWQADQILVFAPLPASVEIPLSASEALPLNAPSNIYSSKPYDVAAYIYTHNALPPFYLTKAQARALGWRAQDGNLWRIAPNRVIGGSRFYNREQQLPNKTGRIWREADINYNGGYRGEDRIVYSNDRPPLIYVTYDHYESFQRIDDDLEKEYAR